MKTLKILGLLVVGYVANGKIRYARYYSDHMRRTAALTDNRGKFMNQFFVIGLNKARPYGFKLQSDMKTQRAIVALEKDYCRMPESQRAPFRQGVVDTWMGIVHSHPLGDLKAEVELQDSCARKTYEFNEQGSMVQNWPQSRTGKANK